MRRIVMDTNVFIAALQSRQGTSFRLFSMIRQDKFKLCLSVPLILEYEEIGLALLEKTGLTLAEFSELIDIVVNVGMLTKIHYLWRPFLSDSGDDMILELAVAGQCDTIVTFNIRDFARVESVFGIKVLTPAQFLQEMGVRL